MSKKKEIDILKLKMDIRALLQSAKNGLTPLELRKDYEATIGHPIPITQLGFSSLIELLRSMPDFVAMHKYGGTILLSAVSDESCRHLATLVARQKSSKPYNAIKAGMPAKRLMTPMPPPVPVKFKPELSSNVKVKLNQLMVSYPSGLPLSKFQEAFNRRFGYYVNVSSMGFGNLLEALHTVDTIKLKPGTKDKGDYLILSVPPGRKGKPMMSSLNSLEGNGHSSRVAPVKTTADAVPVEIAAQIQELLQSSQGGIWAADFPIKYKIYFNEELPFKSLRYTSVVEMLSAMPNTVDLVRPVPNGDWLVFAKGKKTTSPLVGETNPQRITPSLPKPLCQLIQNLLKDTDSLVTIDNFLKFFQNKTGKVLSLDNYGFVSVEELLSQVPNVSIVSSESSKKKVVLHKEIIETTNNDDTTTDGNKDTTKLEVHLLPAVPLPSKVSSGYSRVSIPSGSKAFGVYVTYVKTPSYLCVQIIGVNTTHALDFLHEDIAQFYNGASGDKFLIKEPACGMACCARYNNDGYWYRAAIVNLEQPDLVEVKYVDYGNTAKVPLRSIRSPKPHYLALPAQAVECRLSNIIPLSGTWSKRACLVLSEMTKDKAIAAIVTSVKGSVVSLCLCDTTTEKDIHINECLVEQGLALLSSDTEREEESIDVYKMESPPAELSVEDTKMRLPKTTSSVEYISKPPPSQPELTQVFELMTNILKQQSLTTPSTPSTNGNTVPVSVNSSVPVPPGFERVVPLPPLTNTAAHDAITPAFYTTLNSPTTTTTTATTATNPIVFNNSTSPMVGSKVSSTVTSSTNSTSIRKVCLPKPYTLHLVRHNNHPYAVSNEISSWFWESDLLQYKLFKIPNSPTGKLLYRDNIPELFQLLVDSQCPVLWEALVKETITVYSLEVLPMIVNAIECPAVLSTALKLLVDEWKEKGEGFWSSDVLCNAEALQREKAINNHIKKLQQERTALLSSLTEKSNTQGSSISTGETFSKFMALDKKIEELKKKLTTINKTSISSSDSFDDLSDNSDEHSPLRLTSNKPLSVTAAPFSPQSSLPSKSPGQSTNNNAKKSTPGHKQHPQSLNMPRPLPPIVPPNVPGQTLYNSPPAQQGRIQGPLLPYGPPTLYPSTFLPPPSPSPFLPPSLTLPYYGLPNQVPGPPPRMDYPPLDHSLGRGCGGPKASLLGPGGIGRGMLPSNNYQSMNII